MDLGTVAEWIFAQKEAVAQGKIKGPRILCVGASLELPSDPERALGVADLEEAVRVIREMRGKGADGIKVYRRITVDLLRGMAEEAHRLGMPVAIHIQDAITAREAVEASVDLIVHAGGLAASMVKEPSLRQRFQAERIPWLFEGSEDPWYLIESAEIRNFAQWMVSRKVYLNPTSTSVWKGIAPGQAERDRDVLRLFTNHALSYIPPTSHGVPDLADISYLTLWLDNWRFEAMSQEERERARKSYDKFKEFLRAFAAAGGKLLPGSDPVGSGVPGIGFHHEMEMLVEAGLSPMQVLQGGMTRPAYLIVKFR